nr:NADH dehydrogenase subunit 6 [Anaplecta sp. 5 ZQW-2020]WAX39191.1 NADH dehydrogenase subunit 6 [Anaplecta sp. 5 ZQW-2020]
MKLMMILSTLTSMMFSLSKHPLAMGLILLMQTLLICLMSGLLLKTFWFSYILFLIFLGGMLVLFIYVTTLASNEMFKFSTKMLMTLMLLTTAMMMLNMQWVPEEMNKWMETMTNMMNMSTENSKPLMKLYNKPTMMITVMMALYMLLTLIVVVKITTITSGPLRSSS